jgi:O-antigen/teichoic acid export membrane protein
VDLLDAPTAGVRAIRGGGVRVVGYVVGALVTLASAPLLIRHLGVVEFGRYMTVLSLMAIVAGVSDAGLTAVALREYSLRVGADRENFMRSILGVRLALTAAGIVLATAFTVLAGYGGDLVVGTLIAGVGLMIVVATGTLAIPLAAQLRLGWLTLADIVGKVLTVGLVIVLVLLSADLVAFLAVSIPAGLLVLAWTVVLVRGETPLRPSLRVRELWDLLRETAALALATVLSTFYARIVIVVMSLIATGLATGYFGTALRVVEVGVGLPIAVVSTAFPILARAARDDHARLHYVLQRVLEVALIGGIWLALVTFLAADTIILVLGGEESAPAADVLRILALALAAVFLNTTWQHALLALRRHGDLLRASAVGLTLIVLLTFALVPPMGAIGAAIAVVAAECLLAAVAAALLLRTHPHLRPDLRVVPWVAIATGLALLIPVVLSLPDAVSVVAGTVTYFAVLAAVGAIPGELREAVVTRLRPSSVSG